MLLEASSEKWPFRHLSDYIFGVRNFQNTNLWGSSFYSKIWTFNIDFETAAKNIEKVFCFWDNCIWIVLIKLSLFRTRYFTSIANVLTSSPNIFHVNKRKLFQLNWFGRGQQIWQSVCDADFNSASEPLPCSLSNGPLKRDFLDIYLTTFSESLTSKKKCMRVIFCFKIFKISFRFQKCSKKLTHRFLLLI